MSRGAPDALCISIFRSGRLLGLDSSELPGIHRLACESGEAGKDSPLGLTLEVPNAAHGSVVLAREVVQHDPSPLARRELGLADVLDGARFHAIHENPLADDEAVRISRQDNIGLY